VATTLAEINVIPLVDVMLVLLIIFMVAAPMLQRGVEVKLPQSQQARETIGERLFVDVPLSFKTDRRVFLNREPVRLDLLSERLKQALIGGANRQVSVRTDSQLDVQALIDVLDALTAAGVETGNIVTDVPQRR
jgi:biopolymer transport protein ExbD